MSGNSTKRTVALSINSGLVGVFGLNTALSTDIVESAVGTGDGAVVAGMFLVAVAGAGIYSAVGKYLPN